MSGGGSDAESPLVIRDARLGDAQAIADIYNHYVVNSVATFDTVSQTAEERAARLAERDSAHPVLVTESDGTVVAWGAISRYQQRPAWYPTVELSLYVHPGYQGRGLGRATMQALLDRAHEIGHRLVVGQIVGENAGSLALASAVGFETVGVLREAGEKFGKRLDVVLVQKLLH